MAGIPGWMDERDIWIQRQREQQELDNLLLQLERQRYENAATDIYNQQNRLQFQGQLARDAANNRTDLAFGRLRTAGMEGDITRQQQSNNRFLWGQEEDLANMRGREVESTFNRARRLYGY